MKTNIIIFTFFLIGYATMAQKQDTTTYAYCELMAVRKVGAVLESPFNGSVAVDFGNGLIINVNDATKDKLDRIYSVSDVINLLSKDGWILKTSSIIYVNGTSIAYHNLSRPLFRKSADTFLNALLR